MRDQSNRNRRAVLLADGVLLARSRRPLRARLALWLLGLRRDADALYRNEPI